MWDEAGQTPNMKITILYEYCGIALRSAYGNPNYLKRSTGSVGVSKRPRSSLPPQIRAPIPRT